MMSQNDLVLSHSASPHHNDSQENGEEGVPEGVVDPEFLPVSQTIDDPMRSNGPDHEDDGSDDRENDDVGQMSEQA